MPRLSLFGSLALLTALALVRPAPAHACGGTFCDNFPGAMPVDQSGENILFMLEPGQVEVHIQIQVDPNTNALKFAWLLPLPEVPEFSIGSELLFQELLRATVPSYGITDLTCVGGGGTGGDFEPSSSGTTSTDSDGGVDVLKHELVGAFEIVVLAGMSATEMMQWLADNAYQSIPGAEPILQQYLDEGDKIVAFKLARGEKLESIHPVVVRFPGPDGCVPIRLTRIAAVADMDLRVFALADGRAIPTNYRHVLVNPLKIDWFDFGANYKEVISLAVDAFAAEGHAFVTEFAGASGILNQFAFYSDGWTSTAFDGLPAIDVIDELNSQGLTSCFDAFFCQYNHPLVEGLLATHLPVPDGLTPEEFYSCLSCYEQQIDLPAWNDGVDFAADMQARIVEPAAHARDLAQTWPYLTRMYTTISPDEMTDDPLFQINPDLDDVPNIRIATRSSEFCGDDHVVVTLPDGREVHFDDGGINWPAFTDEMPWEEDVEQIAIKGMPMPLVDNTAMIDRLLAEWNSAHTPGIDPDSETDSETGSETDNGELGCGCRQDQPGAAWLALLGLLALPRRRARP